MKSKKKSATIKKKPSRFDIVPNQKASLIASGALPLRYIEVKKKEEGQPSGQGERSILHAGGPLTLTIHDIKQSYLAPEAESLYPEEVRERWAPHMQLAVLAVDRQSGTARPLSAAEVDQRRQSPRWLPVYFANPYQDLDYLTIQALANFTIVGPIFEALVKFIVGTGFKPELELINPTGDKEADRKTIEDNKQIINDLLAVDANLDKQGDDTIDTSFQEKIASCLLSTLLYNRGALIFGFDEPVTINGKSYNNIPSSVKFAHARDLGMIKVDPKTWRLQAVQWRNAYGMIPASEMLYMWNVLPGAKTQNAWLYGGSLAAPMLDAARNLRKNYGVNFPAMSEAAWAGNSIVFVKPRGQKDSDKQSEYDGILRRFARGTINIMLEDPQDTRVDNLDFNPKVSEFKDLTENEIKYCVACAGLPHSLFFDEASANRATMIGKIQLVIAVTINPMRTPFGRMIADQWYMRWLRILHPEALKLFRIKTVWSDLHIEEWFDRIQAVNDLDSRKQLTDEAYGELAGVENYTNKVMKDAPVTPGGSGGGNKFKFGDDKSGFEIRNTGGSGMNARMKGNNELDTLKKAALQKVIAKLDEAE